MVAVRFRIQEEVQEVLDSFQLVLHRVQVAVVLEELEVLVEKRTVLEEGEVHAAVAERVRVDRRKSLEQEDLVDRRRQHQEVESEHLGKLLAVVEDFEGAQLGGEERDVVVVAADAVAADRVVQGGNAEAVRDKQREEHHPLEALAEELCLP